MKTKKLTTLRLFIASFLLCGLIAIQSTAAPTLRANGKFVFTSDRDTEIYMMNAELVSLTVTRSDDRNNGVCVLGDCSLREAVNAANASPGDDTIIFAAGLKTITLANEIVINNAGALAINGPGALNLSIDAGAGTNRIFYVNQATVTISGVTLTGGSVPTTGGAVLATGASVTLNGVHVTGNVAGFGGGLAFINGGTHRILNSTISANTGSAEGGGIRNGSTSLTIVNSTISANTSYAGGGIYAGSDSGPVHGTVSLRNATITNNSNGGIAAGFTTVNFGNSIITGNTNTVSPGYANEINCYCTITSAGGNLVGDSPGDSASTGPVSVVYHSTDIRDTNPLLGQLENNGGSTPTHAFLARSPIIDSGLNALAVDPSNGSALAFDQRGSGFPRIRDGNGDGIPTVDIGAFEFSPILAANIEELYSAVNNPQNAGMLIIIAPGIYMLSVNDPNGVARPNGGRIELQENMSLQGVLGDRGAVVIDALNLPTSSYDAPPIPVTGAIRMGKGTNSIEWLTVRKAVNGTANIDTDLVSTGTAYIRIAHIASSGGQRGIDVRSWGPAQAGRVIEAEIVDNDIYNIIEGGNPEGLRIANQQGANGGVIFAAMSGNRIHDNNTGMILVTNGSNQTSVSVTSFDDRFFGNGAGTIILAGLSIGAVANGNTINFNATGTRFENNNGFTNFDRGGLFIVGGETTSFPNGASDNTVNVALRGCRLANNQVVDLSAIGARSNPESIGLPGTNNHVQITLSGISRNPSPVIVTAHSIPATPGDMNSATIHWITPFDFDGDGKADVSVFRPSNGYWYILNSFNNSFRAEAFGTTGDRIVPADYDGDGITDIAVYRDGTWYWLNSSNGTSNAILFGLASDIPQPADYDGDGRAELAVYRNGTWWTRNLSNNQVNSKQFGNSTDKPVAADYDDDGRADQAVYRNGEWHLNQSSQGYAVVSFGLATDKPVPADYDGDGKTDQAVFRDGTWYILRSTNGFTASQFGLNTDIPSPGDYDGDGKTDIAVFRPSAGVWYLQQSTAGFTAVPFGANSDVPVTSAYVP